MHSRAATVVREEAEEESDETSGSEADEGGEGEKSLDDIIDAYSS